MILKLFLSVQHLLFCRKLRIYEKANEKDYFKERVDIPRTCVLHGLVICTM